MHLSTCHSMKASILSLPSKSVSDIIINKSTFTQRVHFFYGRENAIHIDIEFHASSKDDLQFIN